MSYAWNSLYETEVMVTEDGKEGESGSIGAG
jgi:hypothetical protein